MTRAARYCLACLGVSVGTLLAGGGCAHMIENRVITAFAKNLEAANLEGMKAASSDEFATRALRTSAALEDFKILRLPDGKTSVVEVEEISDTKKRVTVAVTEEVAKNSSKDKSKKKPTTKEVFYELTKDETGRWVVDDIYLKQRKKGVESFKSVTEHMDLLLSVREFLDTWDRGDREHVLAVTAPQFRAALEPLPPGYLASLTRNVSQGKPSGAQRPQAQLEEKLAVVKLPRLTGETVVNLERHGGKWLVSDITIESKDAEERVPSIAKLSLAVNNCMAFLSAYERGDKSTLSGWSTADFYEGSLAIGDFSQARLPDPQLASHDLQVKLRGNRADFVLRNENELVQVDMHRVPDESEEAPPKFVVSDVTIYEIESKQEKRLSALFTAQAMLDIFTRAISLRDIDSLKQCSTRDLSNKVWGRLNEASMAAMPLETFEQSETEFVTASFQGALTKVDVRQAGQSLTYYLREERGRFYVDDVQWTLPGVPTSMKTTLELLIPIQEFAAAVEMGRESDETPAALEQLQANSTTDFNRMVWSQCKFVPNSGMSADTFLQARLKSISLGDREATVQLGDNKFGARVSLRREFDHYVVDDVLLIAGPEDSKRLALKQTLRTQLARGEARPSTMTAQAANSKRTPTEDEPFDSSSIVQASAIEDEEAPVPNGPTASGRSPRSGIGTQPRLLPNDSPTTRSKVKQAIHTEYEHRSSAVTSPEAADPFASDLIP